MLAYFIILSTSVGALFGISVWVVLACGSALALISIREHGRYQAKLTASLRAEVLSLSTVISLVNGLIAGSAAYALGQFCRLVMTS